MKKVETDSSQSGADGASPAAHPTPPDSTVSPTPRFPLELFARVRSEMSAGIWAWDVRTHEVFIEPVWGEVLGYPAGTLPRTFDRVLLLNHPDDRNGLTESARAHLRGETAYLEYCHRVLCSDGTALWCWSRGRLIKDERGNPVLAGSSALLTADPDAHPLFAQLADARKQAAEEQQRREHTEWLARTTADAASRNDRRRFFEDMVRQLGEMLEHRMILVCEHGDGPPEAHVLACWFDGALQTAIDSYPVTGTPCAGTWSREIVYHPTDLQSKFPEDQMLRDFGLHSYIGVPFWDSDGRVIGHLAVLHDHPLGLDSVPHLRIFASRAASEWERRSETSQRLRTEDRLRLLSSAADQIDSGVLIVGRDDQSKGVWIVEYANPAVLTMFDIDPLSAWLQSPFFDFAPELDSEFRSAARKKAAHDCEIQRISAQGTKTLLNIRHRPMMDDQGEISHWVILVMDVTSVRDAEEHQRRLANELAHVSRLSTIGEMATGLAHELNQPLASIGSFAFACRHQIPADLPNRNVIEAYLQEIEGQTTRAAEVIGRIRAFVRKGETNRDWHPVNALVTEALRYLSDGETSRQVSLRLDPSEPHVLVDRVQFHQVILNLVLNAIEVTTNAGMETRPVEIETGLKTEEHLVIVSVIDSGPGMTDEALERAFDAFYTTRSEGLGMGLPICRTIVEAHDGRLWAERRLEGGMRFSFTLPFRDDA